MTRVRSRIEPNTTWKIALYREENYNAGQLVNIVRILQRRKLKDALLVCLINGNFLIISLECPFGQVLRVDYTPYTNSVSFFCHFEANNGAGPLLDADIHRA